MNPSHNLLHTDAPIPPDFSHPALDTNRSTLHIGAVLTKQHHVWFISFLLVGLIAQVGCGPQLYVLPLTGEDPEIVALINAESGLDPEAESTVAARECYSLLKSGDANKFWKRLSPETQASLSKAASLGNTTAKEMLHTALFPSPKSPQTETIHVDLEALFFVQKPTAFSSVDTKPRDGAITRVRVTNGVKQQRDVQFKRVNNQWLLHHLSFGDLPIRAPKSTALLPGHTSLATPKTEKAAPKEKSEPTPPSAPTPAPQKSDSDF